MDLVGVIAHLKTHVACFGGRVAGAAEFTEAMAGELRPEAFPSAYVVPLGETAADNETSNALYQTLSERVGVVVGFDNAADRRGQSVTHLYRPTRQALLAALLNWRGSDPGQAVRGFELVSGGLLHNDRARLFYQWEFAFETLLTECDGWQEPAPPLLEIYANFVPGDPRPPFLVRLPQ